MLTADLHAEYGVDTGDRAMMGHPAAGGWERGTRTWDWLRDRILCLLETPAAGLARVDTVDGAGKTHSVYLPIWRTRIQQAGFYTAAALPSVPGQHSD